MFDVAALSQWQLLRVHSFVSMIRAFAPREGKKDDHQVPSSAPGVDNVVFPSGSCAKSFVDKSFDQLRDCCKALRGVEFVACKANDDDVAVSLVWEPGYGPNRSVSDDGATAAPAFVTLSELDHLDELLENEAQRKVNPGVVLQALHGGLVSMLKDTLGLSQANVTHQQMLLNLPSIGQSSEALRMALQNPVAGPEPFKTTTDEDQRAIAAIDAISVCVDLVDSAVQAPFHVRACTNSSNDGASALEDQVSPATSAIRISMNRQKATSPRAVLIATLCHLQHASRVLWAAVEAYATTKFPVAPRRPPSEPLPPLLFLAATVSNDRKRGPSSTLRFPHSLLEQLGWICEEAQRASPPPPPRSSAAAEAIAVMHKHLLDDHAETLCAFAAYARHRESVEVSAHRNSAEDEEPRDDETDEEYFYRLRPKSYLDLYLEYFPRGRAPCEDGP